MMQIYKNPWYLCGNYRRDTPKVAIFALYGPVRSTSREISSAGGRTNSSARVLRAVLQRDSGVYGPEWAEADSVLLKLQHHSV